MSASPFRKLPLSVLILILFALAFLAAMWMLLSNPSPANSLLAVAVVVMGALGFLLHHHLLNRIKEADAALAEGEHYIETMAELSQDIHSIIDAETRGYVYMNPAVERLLGFTHEEFQSGGLKFFQELIHPDDQALVHHEMEQMLRKENPPPHNREAETVQEEVYRIRNKWGEWRWFRSRRVVFQRHPDGSPWELLTVTQDISEQRAYEAALVQAQEFESLGTLAKGVAHDLNNILMGIQGYAELGLDGPAEATRLQGSLRSVMEASFRASHLCRQLLAYSGRGRIQITRQSLNEVIREGLPLVESFLPQTTQLVLELGSALPMVAADPNQVRHALLNLVVNALESLGNQPGEVTIRTAMAQVSAEQRKELGLEGELLVLEVQDTGQGMSEDTLTHIFDPAFSLKHPGKGLGLLTVQWIAREHRGAVHIDSRPGEGTRFQIFFPLAEAEPDIDEGDEGTPYATPHGVVLLVDDEPTVRSILRQGLEQNGYKVIEAVDGVEGFGAFVRHRSSINAVLLDLTMPRMNGDEVFREIHKLAPEVPVILMSGYSQQEATAALSGQGLAGFLAKPCSVRETLAVVNRALGRPLS